MAIWYVATTGSDTAAGSSAAPFRNLQKAVDIAVGGDEIVVRNGIYTGDVYISKSYPGWLIIRSENRHGAEFQPTTYSALNTRGASWVEFRNLRVHGNPARPQADGHGIDIEASHHVRVIGCLLHNNGGSGAAANHSDHVIFDGNEVYGNCGTNGYQTSGLNMYVARDLGGASTDFRMIIRNNIIRNNGQTYAGEHTDGNGIILDWFEEENYPGRTLIENNLIYANGGRGLHLFHTGNTTVRRNTVVGNVQDVQLEGVWRGELSNCVSNNNVWEGNIGVADMGPNSWNRAINWTEINGVGGQAVTFNRNLTWNGTVGAASVLSDFGPLVGTGNLLGVDPKLVNWVPTIPAAAEMGWRPSTGVQMTTFYVATNGSDTATGSATAPFKTIAKGLSVAKAGDTVIVKPGTYTGPTIWMKAGTAAGLITLKSETPRGAKLRSSDYAVIRMASYSVVDGFDISGTAVPPAVNGGHGIFSEDVHHITMKNNFAHDLNNTGIGGQRSDFMTIENNECARCGRGTWDSGISIYEPKVFTSDTTTKLRIIVRNNVCYDNMTLPSGGPHTDGNGIIIDDFNWTQRAGTRYPYGALVENNLCYGNGGKGIQSAWSDNNVFRRNTVIGNNKDSLNWGNDSLADLSSQDSHGNIWEGNLAIADLTIRSTHKAIGYNYHSSGGKYIGNASWSGTAGDTSVMVHDADDAGVWTNNQLGVDPKLDANRVPTNPTMANIGWRPAGVVVPPIDPPIDPPIPPTDLTARVTALETKTAALETKVTALETISTQQTTAISALTSRVIALEGFDTKIKDL